MSYILDALNKSEQERQRERAPNLKTVHISNPTGRSVNGWKVAIFLLLAVNLSLFAIWLNGWMNADTGKQTPGFASQQATGRGSEPVAGTRANEAEPRVATVGDAATESNADSALPNSSSADSPTVAAGPADAAALNAATQPVPAQLTQLDFSIDAPAIHQLPTAIQRRIPDLTFASHIYASTPRLRMVSINGRSMREGDGISADLVLREITQGGVVLQFGDHVFAVSILRDWSFE